MHETGKGHLSFIAIEFQATPLSFHLTPLPFSKPHPFLTVQTILQPLQTPLECSHDTLPQVVDGADEFVRDGSAQLLEDQLLHLGHTLLGRLDVGSLLAGLQTDVFKLQLNNLGMGRRWREGGEGRREEREGEGRREEREGEGRREEREGEGRWEEREGGRRGKVGGEGRWEEREGGRRGKEGGEGRREGGERGGWWQMYRA